MSEQREALLREWARLAPEEKCLARHGDHVLVWGWFDNEGPFKAILLSALIEAIRARGWHCTLGSYKSDTGTWYVACAIWELGNRHARRRGSAPEPCDSLLSAYVQALQALEATEEKSK